VLGRGGMSMRIIRDMYLHQQLKDICVRQHCYVYGIKVFVFRSIRTVIKRRGESINLNWILCIMSAYFCVLIFHEIFLCLFPCLFVFLNYIFRE
jgi:hypothetical protein